MIVGVMMIFQTAVQLISGVELPISAVITKSAIFTALGIYAGGVNGAKLITGNYGRLKGRKLVMFAVGALDAGEKEINMYRERALAAEMRNDVGFFFMRGGFDFDRLKGPDRLLMKMLGARLKKAKEPSEAERKMLAEMSFDRASDYTDRENIKELAAYVRGL